jgi:hypothetical protein
MKKNLKIAFLSLLLGACGSQETYYKPGDDLSAEVFKNLLDSESISYDVDSLGAFRVVSDDVSLLKDLLSIANSSTLNRDYVELSTGCESDEFEARLGSTPHLITQGERNVMFTLRSEDFEKIGGVGFVSYVKSECL